MARVTTEVERGIMSIKLELPLRLMSEANQREHWAAKAKRTKLHRATCRMAVRCYVPTTLPRDFTIVCKFTRLGPRQLDGDNLQGACKAARDGVADAFGLDDGDNRWIWGYAQEKSKDYGLRIQININTGEGNGQPTGDQASRG